MVKVRLWRILQFTLHMIWLREVASCPSACQCIEGQVDCSNQQLSNISWNFSTNASEIYLNNNRLLTVPIGPFLEASRNIKLLDLSHNQLTALPRDLLKLTRQLETLNLSHNNIALTVLDLQTPISNPELVVWDLSYNRISFVVPLLFVSLRKLTRLHLHGNSLSVFSLHFVVNSPLLTELTLQNNVIQNLAFHVGVHLTDLDLSLNKFVFTNSSQIFKATTPLKRLSIGHAGLQYFPLSFTGLSSIEEITISHISQVSLDSSILKPCTNSVKRLSLHNGNVTTVHIRKMKVLQHITISNIGSLGTLRLEDAPITTLSNMRLDNLNNLTDVYFDRLGLTQFKAEGIFPSSNKVRIFSISGNFLRFLDNDTFSGLSWLRCLNLSHNRIMHIDSDALTTPPNLVTLDLSGNRLTSLGAGSVSSASLKSLILSNNFLVKITLTWDVAFPSLKSLDLSNNRLGSLPNIPAHAKARLTGNLWNCDCELLDRFSRIEIVDFCGANNSCILCNTPVEMRGRNMQIIEDDCQKQQLPSTKPRMEIILAAVLGVVLLINILVFAVWKTRKRRTRTKISDASNDKQHFPMVTYHNNLSNIS